MTDSDKVKLVKDLVSGGDISVEKACNKAGIKVWQYYNTLKKNGTPASGKTSKKAAKKRAAKVGKIPKPIEFKELGIIPDRSSGRTLIIMTEDADMVSSIVKSFSGSDL